MTAYKVGVFEHTRKRSVMLMAYLRDYNPQWPGCCEHRVTAETGGQAKHLACMEHRRDCMPFRAKYGDA